METLLPEIKGPCQTRHRLFLAFSIKKKDPVPYAGNEVADQATHLRSLSRAVAVRLNNHCVLYNIPMNRKGSSLFVYDKMTIILRCKVMRRAKLIP